MLATASSGAGGVGFWQALLIGCVPFGIALLAWTGNYLRTRGSNRREEDRREDTLWGYTDGQGLRHVGIIDSHTAQISTLRLDNDEIHDILERNNLK